MAKNKIEDTFTARFAKKFNEHEMIIKDNLMYEIIGGSRAYGVETQDSDYDIICVFMDKHSDLYPQNYGWVIGFDEQTGRLEHKELKGETNRIDHKGRDVEAEWRSLTKFFSQACLKGSPPQIETLFVRQQCVKYIHPAFRPIKDNASKFISMKCFHSFKGYMYSQFHKMARRVAVGKSDNPKRQWMFDEFGYDVKMGYHIIRLMDYLDQMLEGVTQIDLMRNNDECKRMRAGQLYSWEDFQNKVQERFDFLDNKVRDGINTIPQRPRIDELRNILNSSIEEWYGTGTGQEVKRREYVSVDDLTEQLNRIEAGIGSINSTPKFFNWFRRKK